MDHLLKLQTRQLTKFIGVNGLHLNHWSLLLVDVAEIDQMVIEVKVTWLLELVLNHQVLGLIIERLGTSTTNLRHMETIIHHQMRHVTTS